LPALFRTECFSPVFAVFGCLALCPAVGALGLPPCLVAGIPPVDLLTRFPSSPNFAAFSVFPAGRRGALSRFTRPAGSRVLELALHGI